MECKITEKYKEIMESRGLEVTEIFSLSESSLKKLLSKKGNKIVKIIVVARK